MSGTSSVQRLEICHRLSDKLSVYWKATGKNRMIDTQITGGVVGMRKTLVFCRNRVPNGIKIGWIMHEFRLETPHMPPKEDWVLCRVFHEGKAENNTRLSPMNNTDFVPSNQEEALACKNKEIGSHSSTTAHLQTLNHCTSLLNLIPFDTQHHRDSKPASKTSSQNDVEYGSFWDMIVEEQSFEKWDGFDTEEMKFDGRTACFSCKTLQS